MTSDQTSSAPDPAKLPPPREEGRSDWRRLAGGALILFLAVLAVYWPALQGQLLWDDILVVQRNPLVTGDLGLWTIWFRTDFPLTDVVFWLERLAWGDQPIGYHIVNLLLHATSAVLLWRVLARLRIPAAWLGALIFAVHPLCVASVAWISELKNVLSLPFYLLSILCYLRMDLSPSASSSDLRPSRCWYWLALLAFVLALFSKTSTVMLPVVLLGFTWWQRGRITSRDWLRTAPFFAAALAFGLMSIAFQAHGAISGATVQTENFWGRLAGAGMALWFYLGKALLPLNLCMIYPKWNIHSSAALSYLPLLLWGGLLAVCWLFRRTWPRHVLLGLGCFAVTLFPVLGFFDMFFLALSRVSDHFVYLPLTALVALGVGGLGCALKGRGLAVAGGALAVVLAVLAMLRAQVFQSEEVLWQDTLAKNPAAWCAHANLGWILAEQRKYDDARAHLVTALELRPENAQAHNNLARVLALQGEFADAEDQFLAAVKLKPKDMEIRRSYAAFLGERGRREEAVTQLQDALKQRPDPDARLQLATLLYQTRRFAEAVAEYRKVLAVKPDQAEALNNLAWLLATSSDAKLRSGVDAVQFADHACRLSGFKQPRELLALAVAYAEAGRFPEAVETAQKAIDVARAGGNQQFAAMAGQLMTLFRAGKPYHEPPTPSASSPAK